MTAETSKKRKVLWLTDNFPPRRGGMAQACDRIVSNLRGAGFNIDIVSFLNGVSNTRIVQQQNGKLIIHPAIEGSGHTLNCLWNLLTGPGFSADYSHIVAFGGYLPTLALPVFKEWLSAKSVMMLRGNDFDLGIFSPARRHVLFDAFRSSDAVCVLSSDQENKLKKLVPGVNIVKIPNGIDLNGWVPDQIELENAANWRKENVEPARKVIGMIGQFKSKKGGVFFLKNLLAANLGDRFHILIVGDVEEEMQQWLEEQSDELSFTQIPFMDRWELLSWYPACDFIALPSFYDGMPNVLIEAAGIGIPIIAAKAGGIGDILEGVAEDFCFHPGDRHGCREALWKAAEQDESSKNKMGEALKRHISEKFSSEIEAENYAKLFDELINI